MSLGISSQQHTVPPSLSLSNGRVMETRTVLPLVSVVDKSTGSQVKFTCSDSEL